METNGLAGLFLTAAGRSSRIFLRTRCSAESSAGIMTLSSQIPILSTSPTLSASARCGCGRQIVSRGSKKTLGGPTKGKFCIVAGMPVNIGSCMLQKSVAQMTGNQATSTTRVGHGPDTKLCRTGCIMFRLFRFYKSAWQVCRQPRGLIPPRGIGRQVFTNCAAIPVI